MANKDRNKRSGRKARQQKRAELEAQANAQATKDTSASKKAEASKKAPVKASAEKPTFIGRIRNYLHAVRSEMRRVTWPGREELTNYSVAVVAMLAVFGVAVWLIDTGFVAALVAFTGLRG